MNKERKTRRRSERGIALLIAIFVLLLISVVAIALLVSSGTETALGANYRSSSTVYYAALAGLEEARGRLLPKNPNYFTASVISPTTALPLHQTIYVINRLPSETIAPWDSSNLYYDTEYQSEFGIAASSATWQSVYSVWDNNAQGIPGPLFKWVRITAATEQSLYLDVDSDGSYDTSTLIYYDPAQVDSSGNAMPSLIKTSSPPPTAVQVLQLTAMSYSNGSKKILQYLVAPSQLNLNAPFPNLPAALTVAGNNVGNNASFPFSVPNSALFLMNGTDQFSAGSCVPGPTPVTAIGYTNNSGGDTSRSTISTALATGGYAGNYIGTGSAPGPPPTPSLNPVGPLLATNLQTVGGLETLVQTITKNADVVVSGPATQSAMPAAMSPTNPMTVVVNGDLTFNGWHATGYGILLVTGQFTFDPDASWDGIVLVIGKGVMYAHQGGAGRFHGAVFLATTVDSSNNPLPPYTAGLPTPLGSPTFDFTSTAGSYGIYYSSCLVKYAQTPFRYQILSFHEIPQ
jgi:hypothetical protein